MVETTGEFSIVTTLKVKLHSNLHSISKATGKEGLRNGSSVLSAGCPVSESSSDISNIPQYSWKHRSPPGSLFHSSLLPRLHLNFFLGRQIIYKLVRLTFWSTSQFNLIVFTPDFTCTFTVYLPVSVWFGSIQLWFVSPPVRLVWSERCNLRSAWSSNRAWSCEPIVLLEFDSTRVCCPPCLKQSWEFP